jgi:hypothetical protein
MTASSEVVFLSTKSKKKIKMEVKRVPTIDPENDGINVCQATKQGFIFCPVGGVFDSSYPKSKLRRGRVQEGGMVCPTLTTSPDNIWVVDEIFEIEEK